MARRGDPRPQVGDWEDNQLSSHWQVHWNIMMSDTTWESHETCKSLQALDALDAHLRLVLALGTRSICLVGAYHHNNEADDHSR